MQGSRLRRAVVDRGGQAANVGCFSAGIAEGTTMVLYKGAKKYEVVCSPHGAQAQLPSVQPFLLYFNNAVFRKALTAHIPASAQALQHHELRSLFPGQACGQAQQCQADAIHPHCYRTQCESSGGGGRAPLLNSSLAFSPSTCTHSVSVTAEKACCCPHWEGCEGAGGARRCVGFTACMQQDNNGPYQHRCPEVVLFCRTEQRPKRRGPVGDAST